MAWFDLTDQGPVPSTPVPQAARAMDVSAMGPYRAPVRYGFDDGERFFGGMGPVDVNVPDYWTLRQRSDNAYETSIYGRGIIRRLFTSIIATGLNLEATPYESLLGYGDDDLEDWTEEVETRFSLWADSPSSCDLCELQSFGAIQESAYIEALVGGDCLVTLQISGPTRTPKIRLIPGQAVQTPWDAKPAKGNRIEHGVELNALGRHVAFWVRQKDNSFKRLPAWGEKSGRRLAWLVYASDKRVNDVRGRPLLSLILQSLSELDKYRASTQRKALINSILSVWIEKTADKIAGEDFFNGSGGLEALTGQAAPSTEPRTFRHAEHLPGFIVDQLNTGEKLHPHIVNGVTDSYAEFEIAIVKSMAWSLSIPPEILIQSFDKSFAASKAANNEFELFVSTKRNDWAQQFCIPIYQEWLIGECLAGRVKAPGLLESWRSSTDVTTFDAWVFSDFAGAVKPSVDPVKAMAGYQMMIDAGALTYARLTRITTGMKHSRNVKQLKRELADMREAEIIPPLEMPQAPKVDPALHMLPNDDDDEAAPQKDSKK